MARQLGSHTPQDFSIQTLGREEMGVSGKEIMAIIDKDQCS